jgi:hypothetical protein
MSFWEIVWFILISFVFFAYLMVMFRIIVDLFRDRTTSGWTKALWVVALILVPIITALIYLGVRGADMAEREEAGRLNARAQQDAYIRDVAGSSSAAEQIAHGKQLLDSGAISEREFASLKAKALA